MKLFSVFVPENKVTGPVKSVTDPCFHKRGLLLTDFINTTGPIYFFRHGWTAYLSDNINAFLYSGFRFKE